MAAKRVLLIEDDPVGRRVIETALTQSGYDAFVSSDIIQAMMLAKKQPPDLILLDLGLPAGGGFTFLERLRNTPGLGRIPVVIVSGQDRAANEKRAREGGASEYLQKPVTPEQVVDAVRRIIGPHPEPGTVFSE